MMVSLNKLLTGACLPVLCSFRFSLPPLSSSLSYQCGISAGRGQFVYFGLGNPLQNTRNLHNQMVVS